MATANERREELERIFAQASRCGRCSELAATRTNVIFGTGNPDAELIFVGEAPSRHEDELGLPLSGQAGALLDKLLGEIGLDRAAVYIANVLKCRPPGNRDPQPDEIANCRDYLRRQVELIEPTLVCTLGNFSTKLLREDSTPIARLRGRPEIRALGPRVVRLYPLFCPAAALYTPSNVDLLREDFLRIPALLAQGPPEQHGPGDSPAPTREPLAGAAAAELDAPAQLGLF